ncbi:MAG: hypothetical protein DMG30_17745 [Acidobacteria bacterium]|nr:MAG: hypothetical protein DMG30_17745 [Acidobacteriota bacterium]
MNLREQLESMGQVRYSDGRPHEVVFTIRQWERVVAILELYDEKWISIEKSLTKKCDDLTQERDEQKIVARHYQKLCDEKEKIIQHLRNNFDAAA